MTSELHNLETVDIDIADIYPEAVMKIGKTTCMDYEILAYYISGNTLYLAVNNPNQDILKKVGEHTGMQLVPKKSIPNLSPVFVHHVCESASDGKSLTNMIGNRLGFDYGTKSLREVVNEYIARFKQQFGNLMQETSQRVYLFNEEAKRFLRDVHLGSPDWLARKYAVENVRSGLTFV